MGTHKILVNGTAFAVTGGTELINGTICKTGGGFGHLSTGRRLRSNSRSQYL